MRRNANIVVMYLKASTFITVAPLKRQNDNCSTEKKSKLNIPIITYNEGFDEII